MKKTILGLLIFSIVLGLIISRPIMKPHKSIQTDVVTVGVPPNDSFAEAYSKAVKSADYCTVGNSLFKEGKYSEAIIAFNKSLAWADNRIERAIAYSGLSRAYGAIGNHAMEIEYLEKEAKATMNETHRADLLKRADMLHTAYRTQSQREALDK